MNMNKKIIIGVVGLVILGGVFAYYQNVNTNPKTIEKLTVALPEQPTFALVYIAQNKGYFKDKGLDVTFKNVSTGKEAFDSAFNGRSDVGIGYEAPAVRTLYEGKDLSIISTLHTSTKNGALIARKDKGIHKIEDIKHKKIGVTFTSSDEFFLISYLTSEGIKLSEVTLINGAFKDLPGMLLSGKVDAVVEQNPYFYDIKKAFPKNSLTIFQSDIYTANSVLAGSTTVIKNKSEAIARFLKALVKAEDLIKNNKEDAIQSVVVSLPNLKEESIRGTWDQFTPVLKLDNILVTLLEQEGQWFKDNNVYKGPLPDFRKAIFTDYLKKVKPEAVTIY